MKPLTFRGERFLYFPAEKRLLFNIREPFYSAGKQFGWKGPTVGLGINREALTFAVGNHLILCVTVGDNQTKYYEIYAHEWLRFAQLHNSIMKRGQTQIYVVQWSDDKFTTKSEIPGWEQHVKKLEEYSQ